MHAVSVLLLFLCLSSSLFAQSEGAATSPPLGTVELSDTGAIVDRTLRSPVVEVAAVADPVSRRSGDFFTARASLKPRRLAPGQSGTLHVIVTLRGQAVVRASDHIELSLDEDHEALAIGRPTRLPPTEELDGAPVYRDAIVFAVPVQVREGVATARYEVPGRVKLDVTDAEKERVTQLTGAIDGRIAVGAPLPQPRMRRGNATPNAVGGSPGTRTSPAELAERAGPGVPVPVTKVGDHESSADEPGDALATMADGDEAPAELPFDDSLDSTWFLGGGVVALLLLSLLWYSRRRAA